MISNKIFEYMLAGLPFVFSNLEASIPIAMSVGALIVNPNNINEISKALVELIKSNNLREKISKKGLKLISNKFNWDIESKKLLEVYKNLC